MRALCVAVVLLNFISVCEPASVACERYLKTADSDQDLTGKWYVIVMSSNSCWATAFAVLPFSSHVDIMATEKANIYEATVSMKMFGHCKNLTSKLHYGNSTTFEVDSNGARVGSVMVFLQRRCRDCVVIKSDGLTDILALLSRRTSITADEMEAFEIQADCLYLYKPQVFGYDHDYDNCTTVNEDKPKLSSSEILDINQTLGNMFSQLFTCVQGRVLYYPRAAYQWVQQTWSNLW